MVLQCSVIARNGMLNGIEAAIGTAAIIKVYDLSAPAPTDTSDTAIGTVLLSFTLPSDWLADASAGSKAKTGTWPSAQAMASGTCEFFRVFASDGVTCHMQGTVTASGGGGDMTMQDDDLIIGQVVYFATFTLNDPNS